MAQTRKRKALVAFIVLNEERQIKFTRKSREGYVSIVVQLSLKDTTAFKEMIR